MSPRPPLCRGCGVRTSSHLRGLQNATSAEGGVERRSRSVEVVFNWSAAEKPAACAYPMCLITASANSEHFTFLTVVSPSAFISRSKS